MKVNVPGVGPVNFPDDMTQEEIAEAIEFDILPFIPPPKPDNLPKSELGLGAGVGQYGMQGAIATALGELANQLGYNDTATFLESEAKRYNEEAEKRSGRAKVNEIGKIGGIDDFFNWLSFTTGAVLPSSLTALGAGALGGVGAAALGAGALGTAVAAGGAGAASMFPQNFGGNLQAQDREGGPRDVGAAAAAGAAQSAVELLGPEMLMLRSLLRPAAQAAQQSFFKRLPATALKSGSGEAGEEVVQQGLERAQAGQPLASPDALSDYANAAAAGAVGGVMLSPLANFRRGQAPQATPTAKSYTPEEASRILSSWGVDPEVTGWDLAPERRIELAHRLLTDRISDTKGAREFLYGMGIDPSVTGKDYDDEQALKIAQSIQLKTLEDAWTPGELAFLEETYGHKPKQLTYAPRESTGFPGGPHPNLGPRERIPDLRDKRPRGAASDYWWFPEASAIGVPDAPKPEVPPVGPAKLPEHYSGLQTLESPAAVNDILAQKFGERWKPTEVFNRAELREALRGEVTLADTKDPNKARRPNNSELTKALERLEASGAIVNKNNKYSPAENPTEARRIKDKAGAASLVASPDYKTYLEKQQVQGIAPTLDTEEKFSTAREQDLKRYVEEPVQPLVREVWRQGGEPYSSNAYGPGEKGVWYVDKEGRDNFTALKGPMQALKGRRGDMGKYEIPTPEQTKRLEEIVKRVTGGRATIKDLWIGGIPASELNYNKQSGVNSGGGEHMDTAGFYQAGQMSIGFAADPIAVLTAYHESYHAVRDIPGLLNDAEHAALRGATDMLKASLERAQREGNLDPELNITTMVPEEVEAYSFELYALDKLTIEPQPKAGLVKRAFNKIKNFLKEIGKVLSGGKELTPNEVFERLYTGEVGRRKMTGRGTGALRQQQVPLAMEGLKDAMYAAEAPERYSAHQLVLALELLHTFLPSEQATLLSTKIVKELMTRPPNDKIMRSMTSRFRKALASVEREKGQGVKALTEELGTFNELMHTPARIAEIHPLAAPVYNEFLKRKGTRMKTFQRALAQLQPFNKLRREGLRNATNVIYEAWKKETPILFEGGKASVGDVSTSVPEEVAAVRAHVETMKDIWKDLKEAFQVFMADKNVPQAEIDEVLKEFDRNARDGYMPSIRFGQYAVVVKDREGKTIHLETFARNLTDFTKKRVRERVLKRVGELKKEFPDAAVYDSAFNLKQWEHMGLDKLPFIEQVAHSLAFADDKDIAELFDKLAVNIAKGGFRGFLTRGRRVPGVITDDNIDWYLPRANTVYAGRSASFIANMKHQVPMRAALDGLQGSPALARYFEELNDYATSARETGAWLKTTAFMYLLGGNVSSAVINLTQLMHTTWPMLQTVAGARSIPAIARAFKVAIKMASRTRLLEHGINWEENPGLSEDTWEALKRAHDSGTLGMVQLRDLTGYLDPKLLGDIARFKVSSDINRHLTTALEAAGATFGFVESMNRITTFIAAYELARDHPATLKKGEAFLASSRFKGPMTPEDFASAAVENTQFTMGRENRPKFMRMYGAASEVPTQFMQFPLMMLETLGKYLGGVRNQEGHAKVLAMMLGSIWITAGMMGLPFADFMKEIFQGLYRWATGEGIDVEKDIRDLMRPMGDFRWAESFLHGPMRLSGIDVSQRTDVNFPRVEWLSGDANSFVGPIGGVVGSLGTANEWYKQGFYWNALASMLPLAFRNIMQAQLMENQGYRTKGGRILVKPEELDLGDKIAKTLGFQPTPVVRAQELIETEENLKGSTKDLREFYTEQMVAARVGAIKASRRGDGDRAAALMEDYRDLLRRAKEHDMRTKNPEDRLNVKASTVMKRVRDDLAGLTSPQVQKRKAGVAKSQAALDIRELYLD